MSGYFNQAIDHLMGQAEGLVAGKEAGSAASVKNEVSGKSGTPCDGVADQRQDRDEVPTPNLCEICNTAFPEETDLFEHMGTHSDCQFACGKCEMIFENWRDLKAHMPIHDEAAEKHEATETSQEIRCQDCGKAFTLKKLSNNSDSALPQYCTKCYLKAHMMANAKSSFRCLTCGRLFEAKPALTEHMKSHDLEKFKCVPCSRSFAEEEELDQHNALFHETSMAANEIPKCQTSGTTRTLDMIDMSGNTKIFKCLDCPESFSSMAQLRLHNRRNIRRFRCKVCGRGFDQRRELAQHKMSHDNGRWDPPPAAPAPAAVPRPPVAAVPSSASYVDAVYQCSHCSETFLQADALNAHMAAHMAESNTTAGEDVVLYECSECGERFVRIEDINFHMTTHDSEKEQAGYYGNNNNTAEPQQNGPQYEAYSTQNTTQYQHYYSQSAPLAQGHAQNTVFHQAQHPAHALPYGAQFAHAQSTAASRYPATSHILDSPPSTARGPHVAPLAVQQEVVATTAPENEEVVKFRSIVQTMCSMLNSGPAS